MTYLPQKSNVACIALSPALAELLYNTFVSQVWIYIWRSQLQNY